MRVDPETIAGYITEDPNEFNVSGGAGTQEAPSAATPAAPSGGVGQAAATNDQPLNNREKAMIVMIGKLMGKQVPETRDTYNKMGRSEGFLDKVSSDELWNKIGLDVRKKILSNFILSVSR